MDCIVCGDPIKIPIKGALDKHVYCMSEDEKNVIAISSRPNPRNKDEVWRTFALDRKKVLTPRYPVGRIYPVKRGSESLEAAWGKTTEDLEMSVLAITEGALNLFKARASNWETNNYGFIVHYEDKCMFFDIYEPFNGSFAEIAGHTIFMGNGHDTVFVYDFIDDSYITLGIH